jgi:hypothetical protein
MNLCRSLSKPWGGLNHRERTLLVMNRTLLLGAAWTASAAAAVGLGFLAVSLVDASASSPSVEAASASTSASSASSSSAAAVAPSGEQPTAGGTVFADCAGGGPVPVLSGAAASGWWADDSQEPGKFEFKSATQSIEVRATCVGGAPRFSVEGPRSEAPAPSVSSVAPAPSTGIEPGDDHGGGSGSGRGRGGSGGGGGGHGSDG